MAHKTKRTPRSYSLDDVAEKLDIYDWSQTSPKQFRKIQKMAARGRVSQSDLIDLIAEIPHAPALLQGTIKGLRSIVKQATENQKDALALVVGPTSSMSKTLKRLADEAETDETRLELARMMIQLGKIRVKVAGKVEQMSRDNNRFWRGLARDVLTAAGIVFFVFSARGVRF